MPVHSTKGGGKQWGNSGKVYHGADAAEKALKQGQATEIRKHAGEPGATKSKKRSY